MDENNKVATWLELAIAPHWRRDKADVRLHPIDHGEGLATWFALSVDGRLLHACSGKLTLLKGIETVERFLFMIGLQSHQLGDQLLAEELDLESACCLFIERNQQLKTFGELAVERNAA